MADQKISELPAITTVIGSDILPIVDESGTPTTKKITVDQLQEFINVQSDWDETDTQAYGFIKNKPVIPTLFPSQYDCVVDYTGTLPNHYHSIAEALADANVSPLVTANGTEIAEIIILNDTCITFDINVTACTFSTRIANPFDRELVLSSLNPNGGRITYLPSIAGISPSNDRGMIYASNSGTKYYLNNIYYINGGSFANTPLLSEGCGSIISSNGLTVIAGGATNAGIRFTGNSNRCDSLSYSGFSENSIDGLYISHGFFSDILLDNSLGFGNNRIATINGADVIIQSILNNSTQPFSINLNANVVGVRTAVGTIPTYNLIGSGCMLSAADLGSAGVLSVASGAIVTNIIGSSAGFYTNNGTVIRRDGNNSVIGNDAGSGDVETVTGTQVDNTDPLNPIINLPTPSDIGLGNVNNTSDVNKPVSIAQQVAIDLKSNITSPIFLGTPEAPTAALNDSSTQIATTDFVVTQITSMISAGRNWRGAYDASGNDYPTTGGSGASGAIQGGDTWIISVAGILNGNIVAVGDLLYALIDSPGQIDANWQVVDQNLGYTPENVANKSIDFNTVNDIKYPSVKAVSDFVQVGLDGKIDLTQKAQPSGVATLGSDGKIPTSQLPPDSEVGISEFTGDVDGVGTLTDHYLTMGSAYSDGTGSKQNLVTGNITETDDITMPATDYLCATVNPGKTWSIGSRKIDGSSLGENFLLTLNGHSSFFKWATAGMPFIGFDVTSSLVMMLNGGILQNTSTTANSYLYSKGFFRITPGKILLPNASGGGIKTSDLSLISGVEFVGGGSACDRALICGDPTTMEKGGTVKEYTLSGVFAPNAVLIDCVMPTDLHSGSINIDTPGVINVNGSCNSVRNNLSGALALSPASGSTITNVVVDSILFSPGVANVTLINPVLTGAIYFSNDNSNSNITIIGGNSANIIDIYGTNVKFSDFDFNGGHSFGESSTGSIEGSTSGLTVTPSINFQLNGNDSNIGNVIDGGTF